LLAEELELPAAPFISSATIHDNNYGCIIIIIKFFQLQLLYLI
jgi:hypothetical protein